MHRYIPKRSMTWNHLFFMRIVMNPCRSLDLDDDALLQELKVGAEMMVLFEIILMRMVFRCVDHPEPSISELRVKQSVIACIFFRNLFVHFVIHDRHVSRETTRSAKLAGSVARPPLIIPIWTLYWLPFLIQHCLEVIVVPFRWCSCPRTIETTGHCVPTTTRLINAAHIHTASAIGWTPARTVHCFKMRALDIVRIACPFCASQIAVAMSSTQRVTTTNQSNSLSVRPAHPHFESV